MSSRNRGRLGKTTIASAAIFAASLVVSVVPAAAQRSSAKSLTNITIGETIVAVQGPEMKAALMYGYFKQEGLNVTLDVVSGGASAADAGLETGAFQFIKGGYSAVFTPDVSGAGIVEVAANQDGAPALDVLVSKQFASQFGLTKSTPWQTVMTDLKGSTFAVQSSAGVPGVMARALLNAAGLPPTWMNFITISSESAADAALAINQVQATDFQFPGSAEIPANGDAVDLFNMRVLTQLNHVVDTGVFALSTYAGANPDVVRKFVKGEAWGLNLLLDPKTRAAALKAETFCFPSFSAKTIFAQIGYGMVKNGAQPPSLMAAAALQAYNLGTIKTPLTPAQLQSTYTNAYLPKSYVKPVLPPRKDWDFNQAYC